MFSVIIVDDEWFVRKGLMGMVDWESVGSQVIAEREHGGDAQNMIRARKPDQLITDILMPDVDGIRLIQVSADEKQETDFIFISGHTDFACAQQARGCGVNDYVLKPIGEDQMVQALEGIRDKLAAKKQLEARRSALEGEKLVEDLIRGGMTETDLLSWRLPWADAGAAEFTYMLLEWNNVLPWNSNELPAKDDMEQGIREAVRIAASSHRDPLIYGHRRAYGVVVPDVYLAPFQGDIRAFMDSVLAMLQERFSIEFQAYAGISVQSLTKLQASYVTAVEAMQHKFLMYSNRVILYSDITGQLVYTLLDDAVFCTLVEAIEENDSGKIVRTQDQMFEEFLEKRFSPEAMKSAIIQFVHHVVRTIRGMGGDEKDLASIAPVTGWLDHNITIRELRRIVEDFAFEAAETVSRLNQAGKGGMLKIKNYIDQNFRRNINLKEIANHFYMNPAYLGQLFKKSFGIYFNDYVLQLRIAEAKKLLRRTDMRVYDIAERIGFNNADYFVSQFVKLERMTPTEYRNHTRQPAGKKRLP
ncbi:response regulator transcription factor [Paenibacillus sp.]|uniref:response regulator transcription factor n=1 Tax=Paenibacillus sp. TaxID=58172 RepID=UPI002D2332C4|nr:helix-turn-helix domain-containing protein [Paenibacillus sp.]HZG84544.1 helix-turn-helix domain-containing protein [Paenibacillus sp.]